MLCFFFYFYVCDAVKVDRMSAAVMTERGFIKIRKWGLYSRQYYGESVDSKDGLNTEVCSVIVVTVASVIKPFQALSIYRCASCSK